MRHQISHRLSPHGDGVAFGLLHSPQQARKLGLGLEGADTGIHGQNKLVYQLVYEQGIAVAVMTLSGKQV